MKIVEKALRITGCMCIKSEDGHKLCKEFKKHQTQKNNSNITEHKMKMNSNKQILLCNIIIVESGLHFSHSYFHSNMFTNGNSDT